MRANDVAGETAKDGHTVWVRWAGVSTGADRNANTWAAAALERSHSAPLEPLAQLGEALSGVLPVPVMVEATELVVKETESEGQDGRQ